MARSPQWVLLASLIVAGVLTAQVRSLTVDNSTESYFRPGDPTRSRYDAFRDQFGQDERLLIAVEAPELFDFAFLEKLRELHRELEAGVPHLVEVKSLWNARNTRGDGDELIVEDLMEDWPESQADLEELSRRVRSNALYRNTLVSTDVSVTVISLEASVYSESEADAFDGFEAAEPMEADASPPVLLTAAETAEFVDAATAIAERFQAPDFELHFGGAPLREVRLGQILNRDAAMYLVACLLTIIVILYAVFRRLSGVLLAVSVVLASLTSTLGIMPLLGIPFSMTLQFVPTLILTAGICDSIHVLALFYRNLSRQQSREDALAHALSHAGQSLTMTTLTTAAGLLSFATASVAPVANVGIVAPIGMLMTYLYTLTLLPALLMLLPIRARSVEEGGGTKLLSRALVSLGDVALRSPRAVVVVGLLVGLVSVQGALRLEFSLDTLRWYPEEERVRIDTEFIDHHFKGGSGLEVVVDAGRPNGLYEPEVMNRLDAVSRYAESFDEGPVTVGKATSVADILKEIHQALNRNDPAAYTIPQDRQLIAQELLLFENSGSDDLEDVVDSQFQLARLSVRVPDVDGFHYRPFLLELERGIAEILGDEVDFHLTGPTPMNNGVFTNMVRSMFESYAIALALISGLMVLMIGHLRRGLLSMLPNILPILATLGLMGWMDVPLDLSSILLGGILLGIAVDDTIHFMQTFQSYSDAGHADVQAIRHTFETTGIALLSTTLVLAAGFFIISFSYMVNLSTFGILACFATIVAFLSDLLFAPALLLLFGRSAPRSAVADDGSPRGK